jgi:transposase
MNPVSTLGIDLAKSTFSLHGVDANGAGVLRRGLSRAKLGELAAQLPPCLIGMEACSGAHQWKPALSALELSELLSQVGLRRDYAPVSEPDLVRNSGDR